MKFGIFYELQLPQALQTRLSVSAGRLQGGKARVEIGDYFLCARRLSHQCAELADVGAHVVERVLGLEDEDRVAEAAEQRGCSRGGEAAGEDEVWLEGDDFLGEAVIDREHRAALASFAQQLRRQ